MKTETADQKEKQILTPAVAEKLERLKAYFIGLGWKRVLCAALAVFLAAAWVGYACYDYGQAKFRDVTIELGQTELSPSAFLTPYGEAGQAEFVTDLSQIDLSQVGRQSVTLRQGMKEETVNLTIQDTTAPTAEFQNLVVSVDGEIEPEDFVTACFDLSGVEISMPAFQIPDSNADSTVTVTVADPYGNRITGSCTISYIWMKDQFFLEYGQTVSADDLVLDPQRDAQRISQDVIDMLNSSPVGQYTVTGVSEGLPQSCVVTIQDTQGPALTLQEVAVYPGTAVALSDFLVSAEDPSGVVSVELETELDVNTLGRQTVTVRAVDTYGHETLAQTALRVVEDMEGPTFSGLTTMEVAVNTPPDYTLFVTASDSRDGAVSFTYDDSGVDLSTMGTYYVVYRAEDSSGNVTTYNRRVEVNHTMEDTQALVAQMAAACGDDPISIKLYVQEHVDYNSNSGAGDPVWYGLTHYIGNCYVHARTLQEVMTLKGYTTQMIWVTDHSHYWLIVDMGGYWRHIDATPGPAHGWTRLMTDQERLDALSGRDWDHSLWPPCV